MQIPNVQPSPIGKTVINDSARWKKPLKGIALTATLAVLAGRIAEAPFFSIMGIMIISIMLGVLWKSVMDVPADASIGITFSSKFLLRAGIILMGVRLNFNQILDAGIRVVLIDMIVIAFTLTIMIFLGKWLRVDKTLGVLIAVGTAVCGAAAIVAVAPLIGTKKEQTAISVACIAILGTLGAVFYIFLYPYLGLDSYSYGVFAGSTLHELAHVIAAGAPGGDMGSETAILVKLGRVALLIPVALVLGYFYRSTERMENDKKSWRKLPIPWFIFGFLAMSLVNTTGLLPQSVIHVMIAVSVFLMSIAMAGLGLSINMTDFKKVGKNTVVVAIVGFAALIVLGQVLVVAFY
ncbi:YeiH family protein [Paenibacillus sp. V4I5]|uniref:YeiH family protein n=1 Tax=Paenibacillus sp. V4I5 TaxID=3042306 RepID=UPI002792016D|nr:YeiH family protein [Paenibacillus sp. V4I5]MDQ0920196.1 putative integral membrane protein (TIGR00698 family) [Paenibacillus sp. V4I5]